MLERVYGLETEYLPVFYPAPGSKAPRLRDVFEAVLETLCARHPTLPVRYRYQVGVFFGNGGKIAYEAREDHPLDGLIETATPECRTAREAVVYSRAFDRMLAEAIPGATEVLARRGFTGRLIIAKNNADAGGRTFGGNENYLCDDPLGPARGTATAVALGLFWAFVLGPAWLVFRLPLVAFLLTVGLFVLVGLPLAAVCGRASAFLGAVERVLSAPWFEQGASRAYGGYGHAVLYVPVMLYSHLCRRLLFRRIVPGVVPFLCTRLIYTGDGHVEADGRLRLSTKSGVIGSVARIYFDEEHKPLIDLKHCFVAPRAVLGRRRRRLHVLGSDSNLGETAELLKLGATGLVLEWLESGGDARDLALADPLAALETVACDPQLGAPLELADGSQRTALEVQEEYLRRVRAFLRGQGLVGLDKWQVLGEWERVLEQLRRGPEALVGDVDWLTKRHLCDEVRQRETGGGAVASGSMYASLRKIDFKYHVLDPAQGYYFRLQAAGRARRVTSDAEVERAMWAPPTGTRAHARGLAVQDAARQDVSGSAGWDHVRLKGRPRIRLRDPLDEGTSAGAG